jgi:hypothetical protein
MDLYDLFCAEICNGLICILLRHTSGSNKHDFVRFEVFTVVTMKNAAFWDMAPCRTCVNRCSYKIYTGPHSRRRHSSITVFSRPEYWPTWQKSFHMDWVRGRGLDWIESIQDSAQPWAFCIYITEPN